VSSSTISLPQFGQFNKHSTFLASRYINGIVTSSLFYVFKLISKLKNKNRFELLQKLWLYLKLTCYILLIFTTFWFNSEKFFYIKQMLAQVRARSKGEIADSDI
jgi:hypothetical protein